MVITSCVCHECQLFVTHPLGYARECPESVADSGDSKGFFLYLNPLFVTICPETFSDRCVDSVRGM